MQLHPDSSDKTFDFVNKHVYISDFHDQNFLNYIKEHNIDTLILAGTTTSGSIRATAVDALQHNIRVVIPREAVLNRSIAIQNFTLMDLNARYADIVNVESIYSFFKELREKSK